MIIRIVKMTFQVEQVPAFLLLFHNKQHLIRHFPGCTYLSLLRDVNKGNVFFTHSHWQSASYLEQYRQSELFIETWTAVKQLFAAKPEAWSMQEVE